MTFSSKIFSSEIAAVENLLSPKDFGLKAFSTKSMFLYKIKKFRIMELFRF